MIKSYEDEGCRHMLYSLQKDHLLRVIEIIKENDGKRFAAELERKSIQCKAPSDMNFDFYRLSIIYRSDKIVEILNDQCTNIIENDFDKYSMNIDDYIGLFEPSDKASLIKHDWYHWCSAYHYVEGWLARISGAAVGIFLSSCFLISATQFLGML